MHDSDITSGFDARYYFAGKVLGEGMSGPVQLYVDRHSGQHVAVKTLILDNIPPARRTMLLSEVEIYLKLSHPNIVRLIDVFEDPGKKIRLVMEVCSGGELYERLASRERYSENTAARVTRQMLSAIAYLHKMSIVHRDIKLENWLYENTEEDAVIKLCDFGFGSFIHRGTFLSATLGSVHYVAPEVLAGEYDQQCDIWSIGVIVYMLLSGGPPFDGPNDKVIMQQVREGEIGMTGKRWEQISDEAKSFIKSLLRVNPRERLTAEKALEHPWLKSVVSVASSQSLALSLESDDDHESVEESPEIFVEGHGYLTTGFRNSFPLINQPNEDFTEELTSEVTSPSAALTGTAAERPLTPLERRGSSKRGSRSKTGFRKSVEFKDEDNTDDQMPKPRRSKLDRTVLSSIHAFASTAALHRAALGLISSSTPKADLASLTREFIKLDLQRVGKIDGYAFIDAMDSKISPESKRSFLALLDSITAKSNTPNPTYISTDFFDEHSKNVFVNYREIMLAAASEDRPKTKVTRVHSLPSDQYPIYQPKGMYKNILRPFYASYPVSNLVVGILSGSSAFVKDAQKRGLTKFVKIPIKVRNGKSEIIRKCREDISGHGMEMNVQSDSNEYEMHGIFFMPNPKFFVHPRDVPVKPEPGQSMRFIAWWICPEFVHMLESWHPSTASSGSSSSSRLSNIPSASVAPSVSPVLGSPLTANLEGIGGPGDFGFSNLKKPERYFHTYRDLQGTVGEQFVKKSIIHSFDFLTDIFGKDFVKESHISQGFHFPVRTQYSTLHMQIRLNSGHVVGADGRGVEAQTILKELSTDPCVYTRDNVPLRYRVTDNIRNNLVSASQGQIYLPQHLSSVASTVSFLLNESTPSNTNSNDLT